MTQASVRLADRVVLQVGDSLGEQIDPATDAPIPVEYVALDDALSAALRDAFAAPHSRVYLSATGVVTFDPPDPPPAPSAAQIAFRDDRKTVADFLVDPQVDAYLAAPNANITPAQTIAATKANIRATRAFARAVRFALSQMQEDSK